LQQVTSLDADVELLEDTSLSVNGRFLAFGSTANLTSNLNSDGNIYDSEIFVFDRKRGAIRQITDTEFPRFPGDPRISANGRRVVFGLREPNRVINIVLFDVTTTEFTRITDHPIGESTNASISANGRSIVFASNVDLTGENPDGNFEIFLAREGSNSSVPWEWAAD
jgi:Tol biopolymer transport system component